MHLRSPRRFGLVALAAIGAVSCGPAVADPPKTPGGTVAIAQREAAGPTDAPNLEPVAEPGNLAGIFRIGTPAQDMLVWRYLLPPQHPVGQLLALEIDEMVKVIFGSIGDEIDTSLPFDFVVLRRDTAEKKDDNVFVGSFVLRDLAAARKKAAADFDLRDGADGTLFVTPRKNARRAGVLAKMGVECRVFPGGEALQHHLVCGGDPEDISAAGPYLARNVSRKPVTPGMTYDVPESVVTRLLAGVQQDAEAKLTPSADEATLAGRRIGFKWTKEFVQDFASFSMNLSGNGNGLAIGADFQMRSVKSPLSLWAIGAPPKPAPAIFWSIPRDADLAIGLPGASREAVQKATGSAFWADLKATMPSSFAPDVTEGLGNELAKLLLTGGPMVIAHGPNAPPPSGSKPPADPAKRYSTLRAAAAGWALAGMPEPASKWTASVREIVRLLKKPLLTSPGSPGATAPPSGTSTRANGPDTQRENSVISEVPVRANEDLPKGTIHVVDDVKPNPAFRTEKDPKHRKPLEGPYQNHLYIGGNDDVVWIVFSENEALARVKLHEAMTGDAGTLKARQELTPLKSLPPGGIGFGTMLGVMRLFGDSESTDEIVSHVGVLSAISQLPSAGSLPVFLSITSTPEGKQGGVMARVTAAASLPAATDVVDFLQR